MELLETALPAQTAPRTARLELGQVVIEVQFKEIKNLHLSVNPPTGQVRISAPLRMQLERVRLYALSKLGWIKRQQHRLQGQEREAPREYLERESHYLWGRRYLLRLEHGPVAVEVKHGWLHLHLPEGSSEHKRALALEGFYRAQIRQALPELVAKWEPILGVKVGRVFVRHMKTRWGSCNAARGHIRLNTELAKKPKQCLEYVLVHEMVHLKEPTHNPRFVALMDTLMPRWKTRRDLLNQLPVRHEDWAH